MIIKHFEEFARNKNMAVPEVVGLPPSRTVHMERINVKSLRSEGKPVLDVSWITPWPSRIKVFGE